MNKTSFPALGIFIYLLLLLACGSNNVGDNNNEKKINSAEQDPLALGANGKGMLTLKDRACYFSDDESIAKKMSFNIEQAGKRELDQLEKILEYAGLPQNFKFFMGDIDNALATMVNNQRVIVYNKHLFTTLDTADNSYWSSMFILAHEVAHHLIYNISDTSNFYQAELDADKWAARTLYKMGANIEQVQQAVSSRFISSTRDTKTHPSKSKRKDLVVKGWKEAAKMDVDGPVVPPPPDQQNISDFNEMELFDLRLSDEHGDLAYLKSHEQYAEGISGIITHVQKNSSMNEDRRAFTIKVLITAVEQESLNYLKFKVNEKHEFRVEYSDSPGTMARPEDFDAFFVKGRHLKFNAMQINYIRAYYYYLYYAKVIS